MASPTAESANAALCACSSPSAATMSSSHSSSAMKETFSLNAGRGIAQVQCAPCPPTFVAPAAAGKVGACADPRRRSRTGACPAGGEHALDDGARRDAERLAELAGLRALRGLAGAGLLVGVGDVAHALAGAIGQLRAGLEHDHAGVGQPLEQQAGVDAGRSARCRRRRWWGGGTCGSPLRVSRGDGFGCGICCGFELVGEPARRQRDRPRRCRRRRWRRARRRPRDVAADLRDLGLHRGARCVHELRGERRCVEPCGEARRTPRR